ncbi:hypothetical protein SGP16001_44150 [Shigella flexneri]|nr:hypothetical protein SGP16001_44150 [Shigella flexneri]
MQSQISYVHLIILSHKWGIDCSFVPRFTTKKILIQQGSLFFYNTPSLIHQALYLVGFHDETSTTYAHEVHIMSVPYTHLTLPTIRPAERPFVAGPFKKNNEQC